MLFVVSLVQDKKKGRKGVKHIFSKNEIKINVNYLRDHCSCCVNVSKSSAVVMKDAFTVHTLGV